MVKSASEVQSIKVESKQNFYTLTLTHDGHIIDGTDDKAFELKRRCMQFLLHITYYTKVLLEVLLQSLYLLCFMAWTDKAFELKMHWTNTEGEKWR